MCARLIWVDILAQLPRVKGWPSSWRNRKFRPAPNLPEHPHADYSELDSSVRRAFVGLGLGPCLPACMLRSAGTERSNLPMAIWASKLDHFNGLYP